MHMSIIFLQLSTNGIITLQSTSSLFQASPQPFPVFGISYIAPYWFDNGLNSSGINSTAYYRETINDFGLLTRATREIRRAFPNFAEFQSTSLLIITWNIGDSSGNNSNTVLLYVLKS